LKSNKNTVYKIIKTWRTSMKNYKKWQTNDRDKWQDKKKRQNQTTKNDTPNDKINMFMYSSLWLQVPSNGTHEIFPLYSHWTTSFIYITLKSPPLNRCICYGLAQACQVLSAAASALILHHLHRNLDLDHQWDTVSGRTRTVRCLVNLWYLSVFNPD
jgi:hypothetical protein